METKKCKTCGVIICEKNWILRPKPSGKIYIAYKCLACIRSFKACRIKYENILHEKESKLQAHRLYAKLYNLRHAELVKEQRRNYHAANKKHLNEVSRKRYLNNKEEYILRSYKWKKNNPKKVRIIAKEVRDKASKNLSDSHVKRELVKHSKLCFKDLPQDLIDIKRKEIKLYRKIKNYGKN